MALLEARWMVVRSALGIVGLMTMPLSAIGELVRPGDAPPRIEIKGQITAKDVSALNALIRKAGDPSPEWYFVVNSRGGDWNAAMELGRIIRSRRAEVRVIDECLSACVLLLAAGVSRSVWGQVGIHRPYVSSTDAVSFDQAQARYRALADSTKAYLRDMNVPDMLFEAMVRVPSENIRVLSRKELGEFGLTGTDPVEADLEDAAAARSYGLSREVYLARKPVVRSLCPFPRGGLIVDSPGYRDWQACVEHVYSTGRAPTK